VFTLLAVVAAVFGYLVATLEHSGFGDIWHEIFWLIVDVLLTSFVIEQLLTRDQEVQRRREDEFAFRTFSGATMDQLRRIVRLPSDTRQSSVATAVLEPKQFAISMASSASEVSNSDSIDGAIYGESYINISNTLRTIATGYIRLISSNREEMAKNYAELTDLANRWQWFYELTRAGDVLPSDAPKEPYERESWQRRHQQIESEKASALGVIKETARKLAEVAEHATGKQVPSVA
jgi:hypothetical protein